MALINLKTNLKSLKYGNDRPGNGSSGQPYIQTDINRPGDNLIGHLDDGLVRGGALGAAKASLIDTLRISKFLVDFPKGPLFIAKQVGLQLSNPQLEHKADLPINKPIKGQGLFKNIGNFVSNTANAVGPTRLYNLGINTLAQVPVTAFGQHIVRHGFLPVKDNDKLYFKVAQYNNNEANNNLVNLKSILGTTNDIKSYIGGPGSIYGLGSTIIRRRGDFIDINGDTTVSDWAISGSFNASKKHYYLRTNNTLGLSKKYFKGTSSFDKNGIKYGFGIITRPSSYNQTTIKYKFVGNKDYTYDDLKQQIENQQQFGFAALSSSFKIDSKPIVNPPKYNYLGTGNNSISNYNEKLKDETIKPSLGVITKYSELQSKIKNQIESNSIANTYATNHINDIISHSISPTPIEYSVKSNGNYFSGKVSTSSNYISYLGKKYVNINIEDRVGVSGFRKSDEINLTPLFDSKTIGSIEDKLFIDEKYQTIQDLVKFRIQAIDTDSPEQRTTWMVFRAFLTDFSDNVTGDWSDVKYVGRGEKFFIYNGFTRTMNIGFKVAALSRKEMEPMYQKLNYLMSNLMPDYKNNFMRGPLIRMTVGNYIDGQPGILTSLSYKISNDTPWEISLNNEELNLPHIIEVSLGFTPIGSQTRDKNLISEKASTTSHIAQNWNGSTEGEYIYPNIDEVIKNGTKSQDKK